MLSVKIRGKLDMRGVADRRASLNFKTDLIKHNIYNSNTSIIFDRVRPTTGSFVVRSLPHMRG